MCTVCLDIFIFKQKTAYEMRISDWSSDVCSSDLADPLDVGADGLEFLLKPLVTAVEMIDAIDLGLSFGGEAGDDQAHRCAEVGRHDRCADQKIGSASCRERVCQ